MKSVMLAVVSEGNMLTKVVLRQKLRTRLHVSVSYLC